MKSCYEKGGRLHVHRHDADASQIGLELLVIFPDAAVGRVDGARPIVTVMVADGGRDCFLQVESRQGRHLGWIIIVRGPLASDGGDRQDQVAEIVLSLESAAFAQEQAGFRVDCAQQVHDRGRIGAAHSKVDEGDALGGGVWHGLLESAYGHLEPLREHAQVIIEVGQQNILAEFFEGSIRIPRQPVGNDLFFGCHRASKIFIIEKDRLSQSYLKL